MEISSIIFVQRISFKLYQFHRFKKSITKIERSQMGKFKLIELTQSKTREKNIGPQTLHASQAA